MSYAWFLANESPQYFVVDPARYAWTLVYLELLILHHREIIMNKYYAAHLVIGVVSMTAGVANASCSSDMPTQIWKDCIVVEGSGESFPNETYWNIAQYEEWQATRDTARFEPAAGPKKEPADISAAEPECGE